jgi:transcriptional regulator with XRE-family HTH domain
MTDHSPIFAEDFAARLARLGITQEFLATYIGLSQSEVSKIVSGVRPQGKGHQKINEALLELENLARFFAPMKIAFDQADSVKEWLRSPSLPNLFALLSDAQLAQLKPLELTAANALFEKSEKESQKLESEIAAINEATRKKFAEWLENPTA